MNQALEGYQAGALDAAALLQALERIQVWAGRGLAGACSWRSEHGCCCQVPEQEAAGSRDSLAEQQQGLAEDAAEPREPASLADVGDATPLAYNKVSADAPLCPPAAPAGGSNAPGTRRRRSLRTRETSGERRPCWTRSQRTWTRCTPPWQRACACWRWTCRWPPGKVARQRVRLCRRARHMAAHSTARLQS